jgi:hypothetical protein
MSSTLAGKLQALQWAVDHWDLTEGPIAEASEKQVKYIMALLKQAVDLPSSQYNEILAKAGLTVDDTDDYNALLGLHWKEASTLINSLKAALGPGAGLVGDATPNQIGFIWKLVQAKDQQSVEALFIGLGYDLPVSKNDLSGFKLSKANASKIIDSLQQMPAATEVAQAPQASTPQQREAIEDLIINKGVMNPGLKPVLKKYGIKIFAGNISVPPSMTHDDAVAALDALAKVKDAPVQSPSTSGASGTSGVASDALRQQVFGLYTQKGGDDNDKVRKILKKFGITGKLFSTIDLPQLTTHNANEMIKQLKKLKMRKATRQQVAEVLALLSQLGPGAWKKSKLSKKWPPKDLRSVQLLKRTSVEMKAFIAALKKELIHAH